MSTNSLRWRDVLDAHPGSIEGEFNPDRKKLLTPGVYVDLYRLAAASWMPTLAQRMKTRGESLNALDPRPEGEAPVRVTIVEVPEETRNSAVGGNILVEAEGVQDWIDASVFYNCIKRVRDLGCFVSASGEPADLMGHGTALPTRGEGSHSTFHQR